MQRYTKTTSRTSAWLKSVSDSGRIILAPPFQRNPVWTVKQQSALIETILLEYPIPELYMQDLVDSAGAEHHVVVDGQQRVRAVLNFIEGEYEIDDEITRWAGLVFDDLGPLERKKIYEYDFVVRVLPEMDEEQIRSIFQRINRTNVILNAQELRHATYWGPFIKCIEQIADHEFWELSGIFTANDRRRMLDAEFVSELAVAALNGLQNKKVKLEDYYRVYEAEFDEVRKLRGIFDAVLGEIEAAIPDIRKTRWRKKSDFYTLFVALSGQRDLMPFTSNGRRALRETAKRFGEEVSSYIAGERGVLATERQALIAKYAANVEKAASDLSSRRNRRDAFVEALQPVLDAEAKRQADIAEADENDV